MRTDAVAGQALVEALIVSALLALSIALSAVLAKYQLVESAVIGASRSLAFECALLPHRCQAGISDSPTAQRLRRHHFSNVPDSLQAAHSWTTRFGTPLLRSTDHVSVRLVPAQFDAGRGAASNGRRSPAGSAVQVISQLAGPGRFGLDIDGGLIAARVRANLLSGSPAAGNAILSGMALSPVAKQAILIDNWEASGPDGALATSVEHRVSRGMRLAAPVETVIDLGYAGTKGFMRLLGAIGLEDRAGEFRHRQIDMDRVPRDRLGSDQ